VERLEVCSDVEGCIVELCEALRLELAADGVERGIGEPEAQKENELLVRIRLPAGASELCVVRRSSPFTDGDRLLASLAVSAVEAALRSRAALHDLAECQAQLHQSERMKSIGQLAGGVAHDFNNMLMVISAAAEVMSDTLEPEHACAGHLNLIINTSHRAAELTQKLLAFSRKGRLQMKQLDLHDVLGAVREFLVHTIDRRITLQLSLAAGPCMLEADSTELTNAILNICLNARDAMPGGGVLKIISERIELDANTCAACFPTCKPGSYVRLEVRDTGTGMDEQTLKHAFDPFFTTKEPGRGTGLGLSVVFGAMREHGGTVFLDSKLGQGTCCTILLPIIDRTRPDAVALAPNARHGGSLRILLLDDEPGVCRTAAQLMRQLGHNVQALRNGEKALSHLRTHSSGYDLLVLDVMMPHPTGVEVHRALCDEGIVLPTIFVSGYMEQPMLEGVIAGEHIVFLQKPFRQAELDRAISRCIASEPPGPIART
jgi:signal transduction histidine kinase/ActR/RegA family two-component response regulator